MAWAFGKLGHVEKVFFEALAREKEQLACKVNAQALASIAWAFAKLGQLDEALFAAVMMQVKQRVYEFNV